MNWRSIALLPLRGLASARDRRVALLAAIWCGVALAVAPALRAHQKLDDKAVLVVEPEPLKRLLKSPLSGIRMVPSPSRKVDRPPEPEPTVPPTPLDEEEAARYLARALRQVVGDRATETALSVLWAHWAHETARGKRMLGHNFAGLKGDGTLGGAKVWTREKTGPKKELVRRTFRVYDSPEQGALDYVMLLLTRYRGALSAAREGRTADFVHVLRTRAYYSDEQVLYERAISRLSRECLRRSLAQRALIEERKARENDPGKSAQSTSLAEGADTVDGVPTAMASLAAAK